MGKQGDFSMIGKKASLGISALAVGLLATVAATSAGAFGGGHCKRGGHGGPPGAARLEHRLERLDLSADVRAKAFAIVDASRSEDRALREQIRAAHEQLRAALEAGAPDADALDAQVEALGALKTQHHKQVLHTLIEVGAVLPDAQRAQWFEPHSRGRRGDRAH
jgi:Spy/CpxP family protein refolding chaperone